MQPIGRRIIKTIYSCNLTKPEKNHLARAALHSALGILRDRRAVRKEPAKKVM